MLYSKIRPGREKNQNLGFSGRETIYLVCQVSENVLHAVCPQAPAKTSSDEAVMKVVSFPFRYRGPLLLFCAWRFGGGGRSLNVSIRPGIPPFGLTPEIYSSFPDNFYLGEAVPASRSIIPK